LKYFPWNIGKKAIILILKFRTGFSAPSPGKSSAVVLTIAVVRNEVGERPIVEPGDGKISGLPEKALRKNFIKIQTVIFDYEF
jgi:hypothetical protein